MHACYITIQRHSSLDPLAPKQPFLALFSNKIEEYYSPGILMLDNDMAQLKQSFYIPLV